MTYEQAGRIAGRPRSVIEAMIALVAFGALISGCSSTKSPGDWIGDAERAKGRCETAIFYYAKAAEYSLPDRISPKQSLDADSLRIAVDNIKRIAPTCRVSRDTSINYIGNLVSARFTINKEPATDIVNAFLAMAEYNPNVIFDNDTYSLRNVLVWADAVSEKRALQRAAIIWQRQSSKKDSYSNKIVAEIFNRHANELGDLIQKNQAETDLIAKLKQRADATTAGRCSQGGNCKGGPDDGDPNFIAWNQNNRDWNLAYARLLADNGFPPNLVKTASDNAAKYEKDRVAVINRQYAAPSPASSSGDGFTSALGMLGTVARGLGGSGIGGKTNAAQIAALGSAMQAASTSDGSVASTLNAAPQVIGTAGGGNAVASGSSLASNPFGTSGGNSSALSGRSSQGRTTSTQSKRPGINATQCLRASTVQSAAVNEYLENTCNKAITVTFCQNERIASTTRTCADGDYIRNVQFPPGHKSSIAVYPKKPDMASSFAACFSPATMTNIRGTRPFEFDCEIDDSPVKTGIR